MEFRVGDIVRVVVRTEFVDGSVHNVGDELSVTDDTLAFFNTPCNNRNYFLVGHCS